MKLSRLNIAATLAIACAVGLGGVLLAQAATTLRMSLGTAIIGSYTGTPGLGTDVLQLQKSNQSDITLGNGTASGQANALYISQARVLGASGTENLDLAGSLVDPFGTTLTFTTIKVVKVCANAGNTNNVQIGGAASNTFLGMFADPTDIINVKPGGCFVWIAPQTGATVTASTGDILKVTNSSSGTGVTYDVWIIGTI